MKDVKKIVTICGLASVLGIGCLAGSQLLKKQKPVEEIKEFTVDNTVGQSFSVPTILKAAPANEINVSKTFVQTGITKENETTYKALRFITAIEKNSSIESIQYVREVEGLANNTVDVTKVYKTINANDETYYYDSATGELTTAAQTNNYYFAVYVVAFNEGSTYLAKDFKCHLSIDGVKDSPYMAASYNTATGHFHVNEVKDDTEALLGRTVVAPTWNAGVTESYFSYLKKTHVCNECGYKEELNENVTLIDATPIDADGIYTFESIKKKSTNKIANGIHLFGSDESPLKIDSNNNLVTDGKTKPTARIFRFITSGKATLTFTGGSASNGTEVTFGFYDGEPQDTPNNFITGTTQKTSSASNVPYTFVIPEAGVYYFGATKSLKVKSLQVELHTVNKDDWQKDETSHWHSGNAECLIREDEAEHTFGDWQPIENDDVNEKKVCSVCGFELIDAIANHKECEHELVAGKGDEDGKIKYQCSKCPYYEIKDVVRYTAKDDNTMEISYGNNYAVNDDKLSITFTTAAAPVYKDTLNHEYTMADGSKETLTKGLLVSEDYTKGRLKIDAPGECKVRLYCYTESDPNIRMWTATDGNGVYTTINTVKAANTYHEIEFDISGKDTYNIGSSSSTKLITFMAVEIIY